MILGLTLPVLVTVALALLVGATVQSFVGLGLGLVGAPVITLVDPSLMPELMLWLAFTYPILTLAGERDEIDWYGLGWALPVRIVGTFVGVLVVTAFSPQALGAVVGGMVLTAVLLTWRTVRIPLNRGTLMAAGFIAGITGTATSIGGPPMAIMYQHRPARQIRTTLAVFFCAGAALSLIGLGIAGELDLRLLLVAALFSPMLLLGALLARVLKSRLSDQLVRPAVLLLCGGSAVLLLIRSVV